MSTTPEKPVRKFPAPCWTQDETLALIDAYSERWYALRRGYLRTADWDAVAEVVTGRCPDASPSKTSAQCRHKMEKLRQRYRAEKQRSLSVPGRFFSSWFFFENMDSMNNGPSPADGSNPDAGNQAGSGNLLRIKSVGNRNLVESVVGAKNSKKSDGNSNPNLLGMDQDGNDPGSGFRPKALGDRNLANLGLRAKNSSSVYGSGVLNGYSSNSDDGSDEDGDDDADYGAGFRVSTQFDGKLVPPVLRAKKLGKARGNSNHDEDGDSGFYLNVPIDQDLVALGFRPKKFGKVNSKLTPNFDSADGGFGSKISGERYSVPTGFRTKGSGRNDGNSRPNFDPRVFNGLKKHGDGGVKRERGAIADMVSSIRLLGEGFMKMEKMKMEMAGEIEKMRMETEMKRSKMILDSQREMVDAFVTVLLENKKPKASTTVPLPES